MSLNSGHVKQELGVEGQGQNDKETGSVCQSLELSSLFKKAEELIFSKAVWQMVIPFTPSDLFHEHLRRGIRANTATLRTLRRQRGVSK